MISAATTSAASLDSVPPPTYRVDHCAVQDTPQRSSLMEFVNRSSRPPSYRCDSRTFERLNATTLSSEQHPGITALPQEENPAPSRNPDFSAGHGQTTEMR
uniref:Uncharacterized protein n=1 Tax=Romanomermis culicivorax TaxID=13658 RepID=A0A915JLQ5_ROMCU